MSTAIVEYTATEAALSELRVKYADVVFPVDTTKGMTEAKAARAELRTLRVALEAKRKEIKAPALKRCSEIDTEAKRITAELEELEDPIDEAIKAEERRKEVAKAEQERLERDRVEKRNARFDAIKGLPLLAMNATAAQIEGLIVAAEADALTDIDLEFLPAAKHAMGLSVLSLKAHLDKRRAEDAEAEKVRQERAELAQIKAKQEADRIEDERFAAAERERLAAEQRAADAKAKAERVEAERVEREARQAEQARIDAERAEQRRLEDEQRAREQEELRVKREAEEAERRERLRIEDEAREAEEAARREELRKEDEFRAAAAEAQRKQQEAIEQERKRMEREKAVAAKAAKEKAIAEATLIGAATDAVVLLKKIGQGENIVTLKLESAIRREPARKRSHAKDIAA